MADAVPTPLQLAPGEVAYAAPMSAVIVDVTSAGTRLAAGGLEGAIRLGFRRELEAAAGDEARERLFKEYVRLAYQGGRALTAATAFEIDDVIDPADTRRWILTLRQP
jgi:acetyl-CoA carboxylase carboxyltransferase component